MTDRKRRRDISNSEDYINALENSLAYPFELTSILSGQLCHFMLVQARKIGVRPIMLVGPLLAAVANVMNKSKVLISLYQPVIQLS